MKLTRSFIDHPESAGETYFEHMKVAFGFARQLTGAAGAAAIHAVFPAFHQTTASERIHALHDCLESGNRDALQSTTKLSA